MRKILAVLSCGFCWYAGLNLFFIASGAQNVLGNPAYQSEKFITVFAVMEPLPRMAGDASLVLKGLMIAGTLMGFVFLYLNNKIEGNWYKKGLIYGLMAWALVIPWFEFYLPYNVMHEPLLLVLFECLLWLGVMLLNGMIFSFLLNFNYKNRITLID